MKGGKIIFLVLCLFALISCDSNRIFEENKSVDINGWKYNEPVEFEFNIKDTISYHNLYFNIRHTEDYAYSNIYFFWKLTFPNNKSRTDTVECLLADETGRWYGAGSSLKITSTHIFELEKRFALPGNYKVSISQAMREEELENIANIGFRVEKTN